MNIMKRLLLLMCMCVQLSVLSAKMIMWEVFYNVNGFNYNALLIVNDETSKGVCTVFCPALSSASGYTAKITMNLPPDYMAIDLVNPTTYGWMPISYHFNYARNEYLVKSNGTYYPLTGRIIPQNEWDSKMYQYGMK